MTLDILVILSAFFGFSFFLAAHIIGLRYFQLQGFSRTILISFAIGILAAVLFFAWAPIQKMPPLNYPPGAAAFLAGLASLFIYFLLALSYMSFVFGMGEAAIRLRLLRELERMPSKSAAPEEILQAYNKQVILNFRLNRLLNEGVLTFKNNTYRIQNRMLLLRVRCMRGVKSLMGLG